MENQEQPKEEFAQGQSLDDILKDLKNKESNFYFFTLDTKGNPTAGVANIYEHVKVLNELGYKAHIIHEHDDYKLRRGEDGSMGLVDWLGEEYGELSHISIQNQKLQIKPSDFILIPEIFANIMEQVKAFPCKKVVFSQSPSYLLELLPLGKRWNSEFGFNDAITTSARQGEYLKSLFPSLNTMVVPVSIPEYFKPSDKPKKPMVSILCRDNGQAAKIAKAFYLQYPIYKWVTFREMRGLSRKAFAEELGTSCLAVWIDDTAGFGTFPLEAFESDTPVIGKMPEFIPEWMETRDADNNPTIKNNGVWTNTQHAMPEMIATYLKLWLEDNVPSEILENMETSKGVYTPEAQRLKIEEVYGKLVENRIGEISTLQENNKKAATQAAND